LTTRHRTIPKAAVFGVYTEKRNETGRMPPAGGFAEKRPKEKGGAGPGAALLFGFVGC